MITDADIPGLRRLWQEAFGDPDSFLDKFFSLGFSPDRCRCIREAGKIAAALYWFDCVWKEKKVAYIYAVATDAALRGRGLCRRLLEDTHRHLKCLGYAGAVLVPGEEGLFSLYEKFGYTSFCPGKKVTVFAERPINAEPLSPEEYHLLRESFLGDNAILQGRAVFDFLNAYGAFYKAENCIFCGSREENTFYFQEFLGNTAILPGVVAALGCQKGVAILPGGGKDTAMYLPLDGCPGLPDYFAIPLN